MSFRSAIENRPLTQWEERAMQKIQDYYRRDRLMAYGSDDEDYGDFSTFPANSYGLSRKIKEPNGGTPTLRKRSKCSHEFTSLKHAIGDYLLVEDPDVLSVVFGAVAAHRFGMLPVWLMIVGASSSAKTAFLDLLSEMDGVYPLSDLTPQTFASGYHPEPVKLKKGEVETDVPPQKFSLLEQFTDSTILTMKDFTSVLEMHHDKRQAILAQLREIYDGQYDKPFGNGKVVNWRGRIGLLAGVTPVIDHHVKVMGMMGPRFLFFRPAQPKPEEQALQALTNNYGEQAITKATLAKQVAAFIEDLPNNKPDFSNITLLHRLITVAHLVTTARSPVERSRDNREMEYVPEAEMPARFVQQLQSLALGVALVHGHEEVDEDDIRIVTRVALDAIPQPRRLALESLAALKNGCGSLGQIQHSITRQSVSTTRRALEDLMILGVVDGETTNGVATEHQIQKPEWTEILLQTRKL